MWIYTQSSRMFNMDRFFKIDVEFDEKQNKYSIIGFTEPKSEPIELASYIDQKQVINVYGRLKRNIFDNTNFDVPEDYILDEEN